MPIINLGIGWFVTEPERSCLCVICGAAIGFHTFAKGCPSDAREANRVALAWGLPGYVARILQADRDGVRRWPHGETLQW